VNSQDPRQVLARRLRALREEHWPEVKVKQAQLAAALTDGGKPVSVPLISSWESRRNPQVPPASRLEELATFFATRRSLDGRVPRLLRPDEMTVDERAAREELLEELLRLRDDALGAPRPVGAISGVSEIAESLRTGPYHFKAGEAITIVCGQLPAELLVRMPYTDPLDPDFIELYRYAELDALLELFGHLRAANPASRVEYRAAHELRPDDLSAHLITLGGVDWNLATTSLLDELQFPVKQVADWKKPGGAYFEVENGGGKTAHRPLLEGPDERAILREDVALFARAVNPFNRKRFVTICNGMYGRGTYGVVRALTDERFRDRNMDYIQARFAGSEAFCLLTRVKVANGVTLTPDWTLPETRLFEWPEAR